MKPRPKDDAPCTMCSIVAFAAPWGLIAVAAALSVFDLSPFLDKAAAYLVVVGLGFMAASYLLRLWANNLIEREGL